MLVHDIAEHTLISTNVQKDDYPEFIPTQAYSKADRFKIESEGKNYYVTEDCEAGLVPSVRKDIFTSAPMNFQKMFELSFDGATEASGTIEVTLNALNVDTITLAQLQAKTVDIIMVDNDTGVEFYNETFDLSYDDLDDFADYLDAPFDFASKVQAKVSSEDYDKILNSMTSEQIVTRFTQDVIYYYDSQITIKINNEGGIAKCGACCFGRSRDLGVTLVEGASLGFEDVDVLNKKDGWDEGEYETVYSQDTMDLKVNIPAKQFDLVFERLRKMRGKVFVFRGVEKGNFTSTTIIGKYNKLKYPIDPYSITYALNITSYIKDKND